LPTSNITFDAFIFYVGLPINLQHNLQHLHSWHPLVDLFSICDIKDFQYFLKHTTSLGIHKKTQPLWTFTKLHFLPPQFCSQNLLSH
jgi:hypothetical protein